MGKEEKKKLKRGAFVRSLRIFKYVMPYRGRFLLGLLFLFLSAFTFMTFPGLIGSLIGGGAEDQVSQSPIQQFLVVENINEIALVLLLLFVLQGVFSFFRIYLFADVTERAIAQLRIDTYGHLVRLPMNYFLKHRVGELNSRISNDISQLQETFMTTLAELVRQLVIIIGGVSLLFFFSLKLTLLMLVSLPVMVLIAFFFGRFIRKLSKSTQNALARSQTVVDETMQAIQNVKSYANEGFETNRYSLIAEETRKIAMKGAKWRGAFASFIIVGLFGTVVLVIWYGVRLMNAGEIGLDILTSFLLYSVFVGGSVGGIADVFGKLQKAVGATEDLFDLLDEEVEGQTTRGGIIPSDVNYSLSIKDVGYHYESRPDKIVLEGLNMEIAAGEKVALVGPSGAGKSTVASLLLRFYDPTLGMIALDGQSIDRYDLHWYRSQVAYVPQEILLFGGTIAENIAYGKPGASEDEIKNAAQQANALEFISGFPEGFKTVVGERGIQLSGGQRQRVAIARAILRDPKILILDEATSSLDSESEHLVQEALTRLMEGRTSIIIAHRLSTISNADRIFVLDHGRVTETGSHAELMKIENGVYKRLSNLQLLP